MNDIFHFMERPYSLRSSSTLERKRDHTVYHSSESLSFCAPKFCDLLPNSIKMFTSLKQFKTKVNTWKADHWLTEYVRNMLDSFKLFYRFCTFGFFILLLDHLHMIFLSCVLLSDIFSRNQSICILLNHFIKLLNIFIYSGPDISKYCRELRLFYGSILFSVSFFIFILFFIFSALISQILLHNVLLFLCQNWSYHNHIM